MKTFFSDLQANKFSFTAILFIAVFSLMGLGMIDAFLIDSAPKGGPVYGLACAFPFIFLLIGISVFLAEIENAETQNDYEITPAEEMQSPESTLTHAACSMHESQLQVA